nr:YceD family protein [Corynebacterium lactis]
MTDSSPFILDVSNCLRDSMPEQFRTVGNTPVRIGAEMIGVPEGTEVVVDGIITNLGGGVMVDATVTAPAQGECVRCLAGLNKELNIHVSAVFSGSDDFITGDDAEEGEDEVLEIVDNTVDITQAVIDEAVLSLPFNPSCENLGIDCHDSDTDVPEPDGVSGEEEKADPRWAALAEKFQNLDEK